MKIILHGAAKEVGRSCVEVKSKNNRILFDCGIKLGLEGEGIERDSEYPQVINNVEDIDLVLLSHAHLDHSGALPLFNFKGMNANIYCTSMTKYLCKLLLKDSLKIEILNDKHPAYSKENITNVLFQMINVNYKREYVHNDCKFKFFDAGHIPGSACILLRVDGKTLLYTGDYNTNETMLMPKADLDYSEKIDILISESTYGDRNHPDREKQKNNFLLTIKKVLDKGGSVIIPAFAVGRAQEILLILSELKTRVPIYLDGMAKKVYSKLLREGRFAQNIGKLKGFDKKITFIKGFNRRKDAIKSQGIFVTTSGMVSGGPVIEYLKYLWHDPMNAILLTGYQAEGTGGRSLLENGTMFLDGNKIHVKCLIKQFDFSAHAGLMGLKKNIKRVKPEILILNHGDPWAEDNLAKWAKSIGIKKVYAPKIGERVSC